MLKHEVLLREQIRNTLQSRSRLVIRDPILLAAAVLLPMFQKDGQYYLLFTRRTDKVATHKGQISFPGGARDPEDRDLLGTALRESFEEVGLRPQDVKVLGELDDIVTHSGFLVSPFVGVIPYPYEFQPSAEEIDQLLEMPLAALHQHRAWVRGLPFSTDYHGPTFEYRGQLVWGITARILDQFLGLAFDSA